MAPLPQLWHRNVVRRPWLPIGIVVFLVLAFALGRWARTIMPAELTAASIHQWVAGLGWSGAVAFLGVLVFRQFLFLPAALVLPVGGLCFGVGMGTALGAFGIVVSALMKFGVARALGREWLHARMGPRLRALEQRVERLGALAVGAATAHPIGPLSPLHWAAGLTSLRTATFVVAVMLGAPVRAFAYSFFGSTLLDTASPEFQVASAVLAASIILPLVGTAVWRRMAAH